MSPGSMNVRLGVIVAGRVGENKSDLFYWVALSMAPGVGPKNFAKLVRRFETPEKVFQGSALDFARLPGLRRDTVQALTRFDWGHLVERELSRAAENGYDLITLDDPRYPARLREIGVPPSVIWIRGDLYSDRPAAAIVGSRSASDFGLRTARRLARDLATAGVVVVSGGAYGIDTAAHQGALEAGGPTLGVMGAGLDIAYPAQNRELFRRISLSGALVSEFPLGTPPRKGHFPIRNRIIAGLSLAVIVVEAARKSGALITARQALEENREVMAVPGSAGSLKSRGAHDLLRDGAKLVESAADVIEVIGPQIELKQEPRSWRPEESYELSGWEMKVWEALEDDPIHVDVLCRKLDWTPAQLAPTLLNLELKGLLRQLPGMMYIKAD